MKFLIKLRLPLTLALILCACAPPKRVVVREEPYEITFEKSNPVMIEKSIQGLKILDFIGTKVRPGELLAVRSIEEDLSGPPWGEKIDSRSTRSNLDPSIRTLLEDNIISLLVANGYRPVERDPQGLMHLSEEGGKSYTLIRWHELNKAPPPDSVDPALHGLGRLRHVETRLFAIDKMLTYRVLECGIWYNFTEPGSQYVERIAFTRLHCRLTDAKSGEILNAGIIENTVKDRIPVRVIEDLKKIEYRFYDFTRPTMFRTPIEEESQGSPTRPTAPRPLLTQETPAEPEPSATGSRFPWGVLLGIPVLVLILGLL